MHFPNQNRIVRTARFPNLRALAWAGDVLYASKGYDLLRTKITSNIESVSWEHVARFHPAFTRVLSSSTRLTSRLFRDGFHALAALPDGGFVGAVPGAIVTLRPPQTEFLVSHRITRGTRPLHITAVPGGAIYWGEYFDNASRDVVHIYGSQDGGSTWSVAYTFAKGAIRHVHNIVHDPWANCLWVLTGDYGDECRILRAACDFSRVETVLQGKQQARAVAAIPTEQGLYFSSDTPLESNFIYCVDRNDTISQRSVLSSSSIYGCRVGSNLFFSTMVEPSDVNRDPSVRVYHANLPEAEVWKPVLEWPKDFWSMKYFQYGNAFFPDGNNATSCLALTTVAVRTDDMATSLYST